MNAGKHAVKMVSLMLSMALGWILDLFWTNAGVRGTVFWAVFKVGL